MKVSLPQNVKDVTDLLTENNYEFTIAGGFCRDTYLKHPYKDVDIFVYINKEDISRLFYHYKEDPNVLKCLDILLDIDFTIIEHEMSTNGYEGSVDSAYICDLRREDVNIILIDKRYTKNREDLLSRFDLNMNMFYYDMDTSEIVSQCGWTKDKPVLFSSSVTLRFERLYNFIKKYPYLKWFTDKDTQILNSVEDILKVIAISHNYPDQVVNNTLDTLLFIDSLELKSTTRNYHKSLVSKFEYKSDTKFIKIIGDINALLFD